MGTREELLSLIPQNKNHLLELVGFVCWFDGVYGISTFVGYLTPNPFLCK